MKTTVALFFSRRTRMTLARSLVGLALLLLPALGRAGQDASSTRSPAHAAPRTGTKPPPHRAAALPEKARQYFQTAWGVDALSVRRVASGNLIRFSYRVINPAQAAPLSDSKVTPTLFAQRTRAMLSVPVMDKIGPLRQAVTPKAGQQYWVAFSNKGNLVKRGDKVDVIIGRFHADGLTVE